MLVSPNAKPTKEDLEVARQLGEAPAASQAALSGAAADGLEASIARQLGLPPGPIGAGFSTPPPALAPSTAPATLADAHLTAIVDEAIKAGKVTEEGREEAMAMGRRDISTLTTYLSVLPRLYWPPTPEAAQTASDVASVARQLGL